jgi:hypothetical protein
MSNDPYRNFACSRPIEQLQATSYLCCIHYGSGLFDYESTFFLERHLRMLISGLYKRPAASSSLMPTKCGQCEVCTFGGGQKDVKWLKQFSDNRWYVAQARAWGGL